MSQDIQEHKPQSKSLVRKMADRFSVEPEKLLTTLKSTAFKQRGNTTISNEQMMALLIVADQYGLNPFTKEIYAFPDKDGIVPVVGIDGWSKIINEQDDMDGMEFNYSEDMVGSDEHQPCPEWVECVIYRKGRSRPTTAREYLNECYRKPFTGTGQNGPYKMDGPWQTHTKRMLRHKALIQAARMAFGFTGIYDQDEAQRIIERDITPREADTDRVSKINEVLGEEAQDAEYEEVNDDGQADRMAELIEKSRNGPLTDAEKEEMRKLLAQKSDGYKSQQEEHPEHQGFLDEMDKAEKREESKRESE